MEWVDVSMPLRPGMPVWPGDTPFSLSAVARMAQGDSCNVSSITLSTHCGTHCDAPWHFLDDAARLEQVPTDLFFGDAQVLDLSEISSAAIHAEHLSARTLAPRVLLRTRNSFRPFERRFYEDFVALEVDAAEHLVNAGVRLVGIDGPSVAPFGNGAPVHRILLQAGVFLVENLRLAEIPAGIYPFVVLPLPLHGADGAPCRAFVGKTL
jgi:arylformamidase